MIPGEEEWTLIFSKDSREWGSFFYDEKDDVLRVKVKPHKHEYREWLTYEFTERRPETATAELQWEELAVPWTIEVKNIKDIYISRLREDLANQAGFYYQGYLNAAQFCMQDNACLDQALEWTNAAINLPFIGQKNFDTLSAKALVLSKMGRTDEAGSLMQEALHLPTTTPLQIHMYGRQLLTDKKAKEALVVFEYNAQRNGDAWPVHVGLARGYAAAGENQKALEHAKKALLQAPDELNRKSLEEMVKALSEGQPINQ
jgi:tetratricopeptide (TPR) repeat protein